MDPNDLDNAFDGAAKDLADQGSSLDQSSDDRAGEVQDAASKVDVKSNDVPDGHPVPFKRWKTKIDELHASRARISALEAQLAARPTAHERGSAPASNEAEDDDVDALINKLLGEDEKLPKDYDNLKSTVEKLALKNEVQSLKEEVTEAITAHDAEGLTTLQEVSRVLGTRPDLTAEQVVKWLVSFKTEIEEAGIARRGLNGGVPSVKAPALPQRPKGGVSGRATTPSSETDFKGWDSAFEGAMRDLSQ